MADVTIRDRRNKGGGVIGAENLTVSRDGTPVARRVPLPKKPLTAEALRQRRKHLPHVDPGALQRDIDEIIDQSL